MQTRSKPSALDRFDREGDWEALQFFSEEDRRLSPEEYAARRIHLLGCFSLHLLRYHDPVLGAWVKRVGELFENSDELERCRERFLTEEERSEIRRQAAQEF